jgi:integrase
MVPAALGKAIYPIDKSSLSPLRLLTFHCNHGRRRAFDHINIAASDEFIHHCVSPMRRKRFTVLLRKRVVVVCRQYFPEPVFRWNYHGSSAGPIRGIFRSAFAVAGLPYFNPHSFRKTLALLGGQRCKTREE